MPYYGNNYPQVYQNPYQQNPFAYSQQSYNANPQIYAQSTQSTNSAINWVQGEVGAKAYPVAPGNSVLLMDSDEQSFYIKSADVTGMPSLRKYSYYETIDEPQHSHAISDEIDTAKYADREEVKRLQSELDSVREELDKLKRGAKKNDKQSNNERHANA